MIKSLETKVVITIPEELVLVEKAEYQKLVDERDQDFNPRTHEECDDKRFCTWRLL